MDRKALSRAGIHWLRQDRFSCSAEWVCLPNRLVTDQAMLSIREVNNTDGFGRSHLQSTRILAYWAISLRRAPSFSYLSRERVGTLANGGHFSEEWALWAIDELGFFGVSCVRTFFKDEKRGPLEHPGHHGCRHLRPSRRVCPPISLNRGEVPRLLGASSRLSVHSCVLAR